MDKTAHRGALVQEILGESGSSKHAVGDIEIERIVVSESHYQVMSVAWHGPHRGRGCTRRVDVKDGKIWIQHDGTEEGIANRLVAAGVPREEIVLAFDTSFKRKFTGFAVG
ncbi:MAG: element excision factor XisI family protein [Isosphaeraceae bacterium]